MNVTFCTESLHLFSDTMMLSIWVIAWRTMYKKMGWMWNQRCTNNNSKVTHKILLHQRQKQPYRVQCTVLRHPIADCFWFAYMWFYKNICIIKTLSMLFFSNSPWRWNMWFNTPNKSEQTKCSKYALQISNRCLLTHSKLSYWFTRARMGS